MAKEEIRIRKVIDIVLSPAAAGFADEVERASVELVLPAGHGPLYRNQRQKGFVQERQSTIRQSGGLIYREDFEQHARSIKTDPRACSAVWNRLLLGRRRQLGVQTVPVEASLLNAAGVAIVAHTYPQKSEEEWQEVPDVGPEKARLLTTFRDKWFRTRAEG
jgi:hypothetical protein